MEEEMRATAKNFKKQMKKKIKIEDEGKILLIVRAYPNYELNKPEYDWEYPSNCAITRLLGVLDLVKADLLEYFKEKGDEND